MQDHMKVPPNSIEAERAVLGSLLIDKDAIIKIADLLQQDDYYHEVHGLIYRAILDLYEKRTPIDLLTTKTILEDRKQLDVIGGASY
jgi:replicative DNA helicase